MNALLKELLQMPEAHALLDSTLRRDKPMVTGVSPVHRAMLAAAMLQETGRPMLLLCGDETEAARLCGDLHALTGRDVTLLRRRDWQLRPSAAASRSAESRSLASPPTCACSPVNAGDALSGVSTMAFAPKAITPAVSPLGRFASSRATRVSAAARCSFAESDASSSTQRAARPELSSTDGAATASASTVSSRIRAARVARRLSVGLPSA